MKDGNNIKILKGKKEVTTAVVYKDEDKIKSLFTQLRSPECADGQGDVGLDGHRLLAHESCFMA